MNPRLREVLSVAFDLAPPAILRLGNSLRFISHLLSRYVTSVCHTPLCHFGNPTSKWPGKDSNLQRTCIFKLNLKLNLFTTEELGIEPTLRAHDIARCPPQATPVASSKYPANLTGLLSGLVQQIVEYLIGNSDLRCLLTVGSFAGELNRL